VDGALPSATTHEQELARLDQALRDLSISDAASVALVRCPSQSGERRLVRALADTARHSGAVTAAVSLSEYGLESPDQLVRAIVEHLVPPTDSRPRGLLWLLDDFYDQHGDQAAEQFASAAVARGAEGDLSALCRAYLDAATPEAVAETRAYKAWLEGVEPPRTYRNRAVRRALSERTAQRSLGELTRIVRALGHRGTLLVLTGGETIAAGSARRREKAYTVMRELVDNFDGAGGALATRLMITGGAALFEGERSLRSVAPLRMRLEVPSPAVPAPPHRSWTALTAADSQLGLRPRDLPAPSRRRLGALRNVIRISEGLPPTDDITSMSVGQEHLDRTISRLFALVNRSGNFFSILVGEYGSGKTHMMMHLAERALEDRRPVFWLNLERTNLDLGNPSRHLHRFLEHSQVPQRGRPSALTLANRWTRSAAATAALQTHLATIAEGTGEAAAAARKALRIAEHARDPGFALENYLAAADLSDRSGDVAYRRDAYRRIFLWFELLASVEEVRGPVILIDEAENLYTSGRPPASRRTSLRSLAFYCGGALPGTCVILALTPPAFEELKAEARDLLAEASDMETTLDVENVARFRRSLWGLKPNPVRPLTRAERHELCERVRKMHRAARGAVAVDNWADRVRKAVAAHDSPRALIRSLVDQLEAAWWAG
jgi:hypothetical protein